tara:strand:+ start:685 stop:1233 length:549 start_codon:yes stop_codon:yes gene_type:complete
MASSDDVTPSREIIKVGSVSYRRANSESIMTDFAATNNFINTFQTDIKEWKLNGSYSVATGIVFFDGVAPFFYNSEIVGISFYNGQQGASGITDFDVRYIDTLGADQGSIFVTNPTIDSTAPNTTVAFESLTTGTTVSPTGVTLPVFNKTTFLEGESLYLKLDSAMVSAQNCGLTLFYKPIN